MATETLRPTGELSDSGLVANDHTDHDSDPDSVSTTVNATGNNTNTEWGGDFDTPSGDLTVGAGLQTFRVGVLEFEPSGPAGVPTARIELWENGSLVRAGSETDVNEYAVLELAWNANELSPSSGNDGAGVQCKLIGTKTGGSPSNRNTVRIGHMEWNAEYDVPAAAWDQDSYRARNDDGNESSSGASYKAAANTAWMQLPDENFRIRLLVQETAGTSETRGFQLQVSLNGGGFTNVTASSSIARSFASAHFADGDDTTAQMSAGSFIVDNNGMDENDGITGTTAFTGNDEAEYEFCVQIRSADTKYGDRVRFRLRTDVGALLDNYTNIATSWVDQSGAPTLRQITAFSLSMGSGATTATKTLVGGEVILDVEKTFMFWGYRVDSEEPQQAQVDITIDNTTTVRISRQTSGAAVETFIYLIEFTDGVRVEHGVLAQGDFTSGAAAEVLRNIGSMGEAFCIQSLEANSGTTWDSDDAFTCFLTADAEGIVSVNAEVSDLVGADHDMKYQVIQYKGCAVQRGESTAMSSTTISVNIAISNPVDVDKSFLQVSFTTSSSDGDMGGMSVRARHTVNAVSGDQLTVDRHHDGGIALSSIRWEVIEFTDAVTVQEVLETFADADGQEDDSSLSAVTEAAVIASVNKCEGETEYSAADNSGVRMYTAELTTSTNLQTKRTATNLSSDVVFYVVDFGAVGDTGINQAITFAEETDTVPLALAWAKSKGIGFAGETDVGVAVQADRLEVIGLALEADVALTFAWAKAHGFGIASEADSAFTFTWAKAHGFTFAVEVDSALALGAERLEVIGLAGETDSAFVMTWAKAHVIGLSAETDFALVLGADRLELIGVAGETDSTFAVGFARSALVGIAGETDTALVLAWAKSKGFGIAGETDTALALVWAKAHVIGAAPESDAALVIVGVTSQVKLIGVALEADTVPEILAWTKSKGFGVALETDTAFVVRAERLEVIGFSSETDTAFAVAVVKGRLIGTAPELDSAFILPWAKAKAVGIALETDTGLGLGRDKARVLGLAGETDTAFVLGHSKQKLIGIAPETDTAFLLVTGRLIGIGAAPETDVPLVITHAKALLLGIANETDTAFVITADIGGVVEASWIIPTYRRRRR